jgi:mannose-6-phosphate isomerase
MGTHSGAPAIVVDAAGQANEPLSTHLAAHPEVYLMKDQKELPFLFKVLSIRKALSIQAHPDKTLAKQLHARSPQHYPDANHKPEMAIAMSTPMEALIGFRPLAEIVGFLDSVPEFSAVVGAEAHASLKRAVSSASMTAGMKKEALKRVFANVMTCDASSVATHLCALMKRVTHVASHGDEPTAMSVLQRLYSQFPDDVGCFCVFLLNYACLREGDAIFLAANVPHAYLSGNIVECMATSDNVVRAGLTPKFKDVQVLCDMLTYDDGPVAGLVMLGNVMPLFAGNLVEYRPPVEEFRVRKISKTNKDGFLLPAVTGPSMLLISEGSATLSGDDVRDIKSVHMGQVLFLAPLVSLAITCTTSSFVAYQAFCD